MTIQLAESRNRRYVGDGVPATMRAARLTGARRAQVESVEVPRPRGEEVLVRIEGCGVCGSDLPVFEGRQWFEYPRDPGAPGHEGWGVVVAAGREAGSEQIGRRVAILGYNSYAEYDAVDVARTIELPRGLPLHVPFPGEVLGCAVNVFRRSGIRAGDTVAVVGAGFLGCVLIQLASRAGARVLAVSRRASAREAALAMGAGAAAAPGDAPQAAVLFTGGDGRFDIVVEAAGAQATLDLASMLTRTRGRLVIAGFHQDGPRLVDMQMWNWRGLDVVNAHERDPAVYAAGVGEAAHAVADGRLDPSPLYTHSFPLHRIEDALNIAVERPEGFMKAVVRP